MSLDFQIHSRHHKDLHFHIPGNCPYVFLHCQFPRSLRLIIKISILSLQRYLNNQILVFKKIQDSKYQMTYLGITSTCLTYVFSMFLIFDSPYSTYAFTQFLCTVFIASIYCISIRIIPHKAAISRAPASTSIRI